MSEKDLFNVSVTQFLKNGYSSAFINYKKNEGLREQFVKDFPIEKIPTLSFEEYSTGNNNKTSFCYRLENELNGYGGIHGVPVAKFGVYYSNKRKQRECTGVWDKTNNIDNALKKITSSIYQLLLYGKEENYEEIEKSPICKLFKSKILSTYYPDKYLSICSIEHVKKYMELIIGGYDNSLPFELNKKKFVEIMKSCDERLNGFNNYLIMCFLYSSIYHAEAFPEIEDKKTKKALEKILCLNPGELRSSTFDNEYELQEVKVTYDKKQINKSYSFKAVKVDHTKENLLNAKQGEMAEDAVVRFEQKELIKIGREDLAKKVENVAKNKGDGLGYDVLSFYKDGTEKHIEVKSHKGNNDISFKITENERQYLFSHTNSCLYYVYDLDNKKPKLCIIDTKYLKDNQDIFIPTNYAVELSITEQIVVSLD